jgi:hypothetical protein
VGLGPRVEPPEGDVERATLELLRRATPLTSGQWVAHELLAGREPKPAGLAEAVEDARAEQRAVDPLLLDPSSRAVRLADALAAAARRPEELPFLAREYASARGRL